jgi:hypothetical protein
MVGLGVGESVGIGIDGDGDAAVLVATTASGKEAAGGDPLMAGESDGGARTPITATAAMRATSPRAPMTTTVRRSESDPERGLRDGEAGVRWVCVSDLVELGSMAQS